MAQQLSNIWEIYLVNFGQISRVNIVKHCEHFEVGAVQKCVYLVGIKNRHNGLLAAKVGFDSDENKPSNVFCIPRYFDFEKNDFD